MMEPRLMLAGGGNAADSAPLDRIFAAWTGQSGRMLYIPLALDTNEIEYGVAHMWLKSVFQPLGVTDIDMWTSLEGRGADDLQPYNSVYIGGGNTFRLLSLLKSSGFDSYLTDYFKQGRAIYGGSAGAIVMGRNILTAAHIDPNDVALVDTRGLDLVRGHSIWCHYTEADDPEIYNYVHRYALPVLALSERSGVGLEGERIIAWGHEPVYRFTHRRKRAIAPGEQV
jgi:dipeptidase E